MPLYKTWITRMLALATLLGFICVLFNVLVDPWSLNEWAHIDGFNSIKTENHTFDRLHKALFVTKENPQGIALGGSSTAQGLRTNHPRFSPSSKRYNLALRGATPHEILEFLKIANRSKPVMSAIIGFDFYSFNIYERDKPNTQEALEAATSIGGIFPFYISSAMFRSSWRTIMNQSTGYAGLLPTGELNSQGYAKSAREQGHRSYFLRAEREWLQDWYLPYPTRRYAFVDINGRSTLEHFKSMVEIARQNHIVLRLFISPTHAHLLEVEQVLGLWETREHWKRELVAILQEDAATHPTELAFTLWDFSGYNSITTESVPPQGDTMSQMRWYWDPSHFKPEVGDLMMDRMFDYQHPRRTVPEDFGVALTGQNIDRHLASIREAQKRYRGSHPQDINEIENLARESFPKHSR